MAYEGNLRVLCALCCSRLFFTFNDLECTGPMPIEGAFYMERRENNHHHRHIEGYCDNIPAGDVRVGFNVGQCGKTWAMGDAHTGWVFVSRIMIAEVPSPQQ